MKNQTSAAPKLKIKKGATVEVVTGADRGKKGTVLFIDKDNLKIKVEGVKMMTHYDRKDGLLRKEAFIDYSNVKLVEQAKSKSGTKKKATKSK